MTVLATAANTPFSSAPLWYLTRSTAITSFVLLTLTMVLGVASTQRALASSRWPRFATQALHRNVSLLAVVLLSIHIATTVLDSYVKVGWLNVVVPFTSSYQRLGVGLGSIAVDVLLVIVGSSLLRLHLSAKTWRRIHLTAYALWPLSLLHFLVSGTDAKAGQFGLWLALGAAGFVGAAAGLRFLTTNQAIGPIASLR
jgi:sulfoxide reductase heme-binding subunit YedZ